MPRDGLTVLYAFNGDLKGEAGRRGGANRNLPRMTKGQSEPGASRLDLWSRDFDEEEIMYALFEGTKQIGSPFSTEKEVWQAALIEGLVVDVPVADEEGGQVLPKGYHVARVDEAYDPLPDWKLPKEIS
jgi:hypothetical protein